jgi:hypothetical protein
MSHDQLHWPTLSELNDELDKELWDSDENAKLWREAEIDHEIARTFNVAASTAPGPPPAAPIICNPKIPTLAALNAAMILSEDRLFFISIPFSSNDIREWRLVQLEYDLSIACSPSCIETGRFLCSFYISHPADFRYNAVNQRFWLQHFKETDLRHPDQPHDLHLVKPSTTSTAFAIKNNLVIAKKYVNLLHEDTFIHGPFNFATVHNRKTRDRISQEDWQILANHSHMFQNSIPSFDVPTYSIHVDNGIYFSFPNKHYEMFYHDSDEDSLFNDKNDSI